MGQGGGGRRGGEGLGLGLVCCNPRLGGVSWGESGQTCFSMVDGGGGGGLVSGIQHCGSGCSM